MHRTDGTRNLVYTQEPLRTYFKLRQRLSNLSLMARRSRSLPRLVEEQLPVNFIDPNSLLNGSVLATPDRVYAESQDRRPDTISIFGVPDEMQQEQLAYDAWAIGLRALANAQARAEEARLQDIGGALIDDIDRQLKAHIEDQQ